MLDAETFIPPTDTQIAQGAAFSRRRHGTSGPVNVSFPVRSQTLLHLGVILTGVVDPNANPRGAGLV